MIESILRAIALFLCVTGFQAISIMVGSLIFTLFGAPNFIPVFGRYYGFLTSRVLNFTLPAKLIGWGIGGFGCVIGFFSYDQVLGNPRSEIEWWALLIAALRIFLYTSYNFLFFKIFDSSGVMDSMMTMGLLRDRIRDNSNNIRDAEGALRSLARTSFVDMFSATFLSLLASAALSLFAAAKVGLISVSPGVELSLGQALGATFSITTLGASDSVFVGEHWFFLRMLLQFTFFIIVATYISLGADLIRNEHLDSAAAMLMRAEEKAVAGAEPKAPAPIPETPPSAPVIEAPPAAAAAPTDPAPPAAAN